MQLTICDAMLLAKYPKSQLKIRCIRQAISNKKCRLQAAAAKQKRVPDHVNSSNASFGNNTNISSVTAGSSIHQKNGSVSVITTSASTSLQSKSNSIKSKKFSARKLPTRATSKVHIAKASHQNPIQVMKVNVEQNESISKLQAAYEWAVSKKVIYSNKAELAKKASTMFNVTVVPQTLYKLIRERQTKYSVAWTKDEVT